MSSHASQGLGTRTVRGMLWTYGSYVGGRGLVLVSTAILARLLAPEDFGLVALALTFIALLETLSDFGVSQALVLVRDEETEDKAETVFVVSVAMGAGLTLLTAAAAPFAASFFDEPELIALLPVLGVNLLIRSFGTTNYALAQKRMDFRARTAAELADVVVRAFTGVLLAVAGFGAWSLVLGYLAGSVVFTVMLFVLVRWTPRLRPKWSHLRGLIGFGGALTGVNVLAAVIANADYLVIASALGAEALGFYSLAFRLPELLILNLSVVAARVLFPAFATLDRESLGRAFLTSLRYSMILSLPLSVALVVFAGPLIEVAFSDRWAAAAAPMRVLALYTFSLTIAIPAGAAYKATGRAHVLLKLAIPRTIALVVAVVLFVDQGLVAVAVCQAAVACSFDVFGTVLAARLLGVGLPAIARAAWPAVAASTGLTAVMLGVNAVLDAPVPKLAVTALVGGATYLLLLRLVAPDILARLRTAAAPDRVPPPLAEPIAFVEADGANARSL